MMHIVGFRHEFARKETLTHPNEAERNSSPAVGIGPYDLNSLM